MTTTDTFQVAHLVEVAWDPCPEGSGVRAECSCGWAGDWRAELTTAVDDGTDHREVAVGPPDGMDRLMSSLLDLQDDLADAVMWLAEHWSVDLPVPFQHGTGDPAAVMLLAYSCDESELAPLAELLEVEPVDDPRPDSTGVRYRRATRRFGRVSLQAYRQLDAVCQRCGTTHTEDRCPHCEAARRVDAGAA